MIWNSQRVAVDDALACCISEEIGGACSAEPGGMGREEQREVARAVASLVAGELPRGGVPSDYLALLAARALWAVGEEDAARRLIELKSDELPLPAMHADVAFMPDMSLPVWRAMTSSRAVRPSALFDSAGGALWILDLARALASEQERLELTMFRLISAVLEKMAPLWDRSGGKGTLGLLGVNEVASTMLKRPGGSKKTEALAAEIRGRCMQKLQSLRSARGWERPPVVLSLDW